MVVKAGRGTVDALTGVQILLHRSQTQRIVPATFAILCSVGAVVEAGCVRFDVMTSEGRRFGAGVSVASGEGARDEQKRLQ